MAQYQSARTRHAAIRLKAYAAARHDVIHTMGVHPRLDLRGIDGAALTVWEATWTARHPSGRGGWDWRALLQRRPRRAAVFDLAIWWGEDLCGLALGHASRHRSGGVRHTMSLTYVERRPDPPPVPLRGLVVPLSIAAARNYGLALGATRLRLRNPDRDLLWYYRQLGFEVARERNRAVYCEQEI